MKKILSYVSIAIIGAVGLVMAGCSATPLTQSQVTLQSQAYTAKMSCYDRLKARDIQLTSMLSHIPEDQIALVMVLNQMQESNKSMMAIATGHSADPCSSGAGAFDVQIAEVKYKNHAVEVVGGDVISLGKWVAGVVAISNVSSDLAETGGSTTTTNVSGNKNSVGSNNATASAGGVNVSGNTLAEGASVDSSADNSVTSNDDHSANTDRSANNDHSANNDNRELSSNDNRTNYDNPISEPDDGGEIIVFGEDEI